MFERKMNSWIQECRELWHKALAIGDETEMLHLEGQMYAYRKVKEELK